MTLNEIKNFFHSSHYEYCTVEDLKVGDVYHLQDPDDYRATNFYGVIEHQCPTNVSELWDKKYKVVMGKTFFCDEYDKLKLFHARVPVAFDRSLPCRKTSLQQSSSGRLEDVVGR